jgi:hypothetical protein
MTIIGLCIWVVIFFVSVGRVEAFMALINGGTDIPNLKKYDAFFDGQLARQANTAVSNAVRAGITKCEVYFPPVPNLDEVKFGTPLNKKFGTNVVAKGMIISPLAVSSFRVTFVIRHPCFF